MLNFIFFQNKKKDAKNNDVNIKKKLFLRIVLAVEVHPNTHTLVTNNGQPHKEMMVEFHIIPTLFVLSFTMRERTKNEINIG